MGPGPTSTFEQRAEVTKPNRGGPNGPVRPAPGEHVGSAALARGGGSSPRSPGPPLGGPWPAPMRSARRWHTKCMQRSRPSSVTSPQRWPFGEARAGIAAGASLASRIVSKNSAAAVHSDPNVRCAATEGRPARAPNLLQNRPPQPASPRHCARSGFVQLGDDTRETGTRGHLGILPERRSTPASGGARARSKHGATRQDLRREGR